MSKDADTIAKVIPGTGTVQNLVRIPNEGFSSFFESWATFKIDHISKYGAHPSLWLHAVHLH